MQMLSRSPLAAYRKVDLDARIEASRGEDLTRICLEEAVAALKRVELSAAGGGGVHEALSRAHSIALWLCRAVSPANPLHDALVEFYGGLAAIIRRNMVQPKLDELTQVRIDFEDLLQAARG